MDEQHDYYSNSLVVGYRSFVNVPLYTLVAIQWLGLRLRFCLI